MVKLPSNKKFGYFFITVFLIISLYLYINNIFFYAVILNFITCIFFLIILINDKLLEPLNKLWMSLGLFLGKLVSPIVLGLIFFLIILPFSIVFKIFGRDELKLKKIQKKTYWIKRDIEITKENFRNQY